MKVERKIGKITVTFYKYKHLYYAVLPKKVRTKNWLGKPVKDNLAEKPIDPRKHDVYLDTVNTDIEKIRWATLKEMQILQSAEPKPILLTITEIKDKDLTLTDLIYKEKFLLYEKEVQDHNVIVESEDFLIEPTIILESKFLSAVPSKRKFL